MLVQLNVKNFAIAEEVEIQFDQGMTVLTGETGAGKSIILDALGLTLGDRADTSMVRHGQPKAEISASFDVSALNPAAEWLKSHDLDDENQCILRRVIGADGRSRGYINGQPASLQSLKEIGEQLIDIHSQHEHQSLLKKDHHKDILDAYADCETLSKSVKKAFIDWSGKAQKLEQLKGNQEELSTRLQLLDFQIEELQQLGLEEGKEEGEIETLEKEQARLANAEQLLKQAHIAQALCAEDEINAEQLVHQAVSSLESLPGAASELEDALRMLSEAQIQISEAADSIRHFIDGFELDPERLELVESRLSQAYQLARKHRCQPQDLGEILSNMTQERSELAGGEYSVEQLTEEVTRLKKHYLALADEQLAIRRKAAKKLEASISRQLAEMDMSSVKLVVNFSPLEKTSLSAYGTHNIEFLISTNPGQPAKPLNKVASGGELSRISLAIQVVIAQSSRISTLVFDEVDVGIGGATAEIVGKLLQALGNNGQVICVTHLPQVASQGEQHFFISKKQEGEVVRSYIDRLDNDARTKEIARMLGGVNITESTLAHAKEMLEN